MRADLPVEQAGAVRDALEVNQVDPVRLGLRAVQREAGDGFRRDE